ncbi:MAG: CcmD family protein [Myxococcota bacterium]
MRTLVLAGALMTLFPAAVVAQEAEPSQPPRTRSLPPGFEPIRGKSEAAKVAAEPLVVGAYGAVLAGLFGYVIYVVRSQSGLARRLEELERRVDRTTS